MDIATDTVYFVFKNGISYYSLGVSHESYGSKVFLGVFTVNRKNLFQKECTTNSFGEAKAKLKTIKDVEDSVIRESGFDFPIIFYKADKYIFFLICDSYTFFQFNLSMNTEIY